MTQLTDIAELKTLLDAGKIPQIAYDAAVSAMQQQAQLTGNGALAQGDHALAVGAGGIYVGGDYKILIQQGTQPSADPVDMKRAYLARILQSADTLPLSATEKELKLSSVYTALLTQRSEADGIEKSINREAKRLSALDVLNTEQKLVLLGGPGSGKSTFVNFVALSMAGELLRDSTLNLASLTAPLPKEQDSREEPLPQRWDHGGLLPVLITLRDFASQLPPLGHKVNAETVCTHLQKKLQADALGDFYPHLKNEMLQGRALILFDGLDEVPDAEDKRVQIKQAVQAFASIFSRSRFLVTSRTYAYQRQDWKLDGFAAVDLLPFTRGQIHRFVKAWYQQMVHLHKLTATSAQDRAEVLLRTVDRNERLFKLAERPLLLTLIAQIQTDKGGDLPEKPEQLYDKAVEMLLNQWESMKVVTDDDGNKIIEPSLAEYLNAGKEQIRRQLNRLAFEAHRDQPKLEGTASIQQSVLIDALMDANTSTNVNHARLAGYLRDRAGILAAHGNKMYQFPHRSFQEYLAACHLTDNEFPDKLTDLFRADTNRWREVLLLAGAKAARGAAVNAWTLSETLCLNDPKEQDDEKDHYGALLAGRVLVESADLTQVARRDQPKRDRIRTWQLAILRQNILPALDRALAGRTLAALGDPRFDPQRFYLPNDEMLGFEFIREDPQFRIGTGKADKQKAQAYDDEINDAITPVSAGYLARYPVTVAQFRVFVEATKFKLGNQDALRDPDNHPVRFVSWHEARAYCDWLNDRLLNEPTLQSNPVAQWLRQGWRIGLPSELEWEHAARGGKRDLVYPWGDQPDPNRANYDDTGIANTSSVGCFPPNEYGLYDMSGNVWEWTRSHYKDYPYIADDGREDLNAGDDVRRVLRGGSWLNVSQNLRAANRSYFDPSRRSDLIGFRLARTLP